MSKKGPLTLVIDNEADIPVKAGLVMQYLWKGIKGGPVVVTFSRLARTAIQNRRFHALIGDIAKQVTFEGGRTFHARIWKAKLVEQFEKELMANGESLRVPSEVTRSLDGERVITVRPSTTDFSAKEAAMFIEYLYCQGVELGVKFNDQALKVYEEYAKAA